LDRAPPRVAEAAAGGEQGDSIGIQWNQGGGQYDGGHGVIETDEAATYSAASGISQISRGSSFQPERDKMTIPAPARFLIFRNAPAAAYAMLSVKSPRAPIVRNTAVLSEILDVSAPPSSP
jgi:hypothetical protein